MQTILRAGGRIVRGAWRLAACFIVLAFGSVAAEPGAVKVIPQGEWNPGGAGPVPGKMKAHRDGITSLVIHHTQTPNEAPAMEQARLRSVRRYHMVEREWGDVAYHFFIGSSGQVYEGRDWHFEGDSGTEYDLNGRLLICLLGDFTETMPSEKAIASLLHFVAAKLHEHRLTPAGVVTHQMVAATDCPGAAMQKWFEEEGKVAITRVFEGVAVKP